MQKVKIEPFFVIGLAIRTTNENAQAATDIENLWGKFLAEDIKSVIPNKVDDTVYCLYTEYESDYTKPYTTILGCKVTNLDNIPEGMVGKSFEGGDYTKMSARGDLMKGLIVDKWNQIWNMDLDRSYTADFEVFGEKAQNPSDAEIDFLISIN
jgi:predicted transcriptional regulator YdeE